MQTHTHTHNPPATLQAQHLLLIRSAEALKRNRIKQSQKQQKPPEQPTKQHLWAFSGMPAGQAGKDC